MAMSMDSIKSLAGVVAIAALWPGAALSAPLSDIKAITAGWLHTCALTMAGGVKCWGSNFDGQLGDGTATDRSTAVDVVGLTSGVTSISAGLSTTCAVTSAGGVKCWGSGVLGNGEGSSTARTPVDVAGLTSGATAVSVGYMSSCALLASGGVKCWGRNHFGEAGDGTTMTMRTAPVDVQGLTAGATAIDTEMNVSCALMAGGGVKCWGYNSYGAAGDGTTSWSRPTPADVVGLPVATVGISAAEASCAIGADGILRCWGHTADQLGSGEFGGTAFPPIQIPGLSADIASVASGYWHKCVLTTNGTVKCWGNNEEGQLGDGTTTNRLTAREVTGLSSGALAVAAGSNHGCAVLGDRSVKCWGYNVRGQLGNGSVSAFEPFPTTVGFLLPQVITFDPPGNRNISDGPFTLAASASSGLAIHFLSVTPSVCTVSGASVTLAALGICTIRATQAGDSNYSVAPQVERTFRVVGTPSGAGPRLGNISTRMQVLSGDDVLIGGFVISGAGKTVVVRARGPSLGSAGVSNALANPRLRLYAGQSMVASNDDWQTGSSASVLQSIGLAPAEPLESAILVTLPNGAYTAIVDGAGGATGVGIVEVFEVDRAEIPLINISTRGRVLTGEDVMIAGWVIEGTSPLTVVVRARGPSLAAFGVPGLLANPMLQLFRSSDQSQVAVNDDWGAASNAPQLSASGFAPSNAQEAAILITLQPGAYTAMVTGVGGTTGVAIVEVFAVQ